MLNEKEKYIIKSAENWLVERSDFFVPFNWENPKNKREYRKSFAELGILLYVSDKLDYKINSDLNRILNKNSTSSKYLDLIRRHPHEARFYATPTVCSIGINSRDKETKSIVRNVLDSDSLLRKERVPMRELDLAQLRAICGLRPHLDIEGIINRSLISNPPHPIRCDIKEAYTLTHDVFYCYDFGHENRFLDNPKNYNLKETFDALTLRFFADGHTDVVLELVTTGLLMGQISESIVNLVFDWIRSLVDEYGFIPGPKDKSKGSFIDSKKKKNRGEETDEWRQHYHTNLVGIMAGEVIGKEHNTQHMSSQINGVDDIAKVLNLLSKYNLKKASKVIKNIPKETKDKYREIIEIIIDFLKSQQRSDGSFGYWPDERHQYQLEGGDKFKQQLVNRVSKECRESIEILTQKNDT
jgi:hypothetical protein